MYISLRLGIVQETDTDHEAGPGHEIVRGVGHEIVIAGVVAHVPAAEAVMVTKNQADRKYRWNRLWEM